MQHIEGRARALRDAGMPGTWQELKARALLDLLQERDSRPVPGESAANGGSQDAGDIDGHRPDDPGPDDASPDDPGLDDPGLDDPGLDDPEPDGAGPDGPGPGPRYPGPAPGSGPAGSGRPADAGPSIGALITITVPHTALTGNTGPPGEVGGFGILDHADTRDLIAAAARDPATRWCLTTLLPDGTAATHDCATGPHRWPSGQGPPGHGPPGHGPPEPVTLGGILELLGITGLTTVIRGPCQHTGAEERYRPSRRLTHRVKARNTTCTAPGCGRRAATCDLDHTDPHHQGGLTCECNLAPLCRHHPRCKQAEGWRLEQPEPGVMVWHTPSGRSYTTTPTQYAA